MITEDYVSFETAKLLKEKGFDISVIKYYMLDGELMESNPEWNWNDGPFYSRPSLAMAMKWLREVHNVYIEVCVDAGYIYGDVVFKSAVYNDVLDCLSKPESFPSYEEACEAAIKYCMENLI